MDKKFSEEIGEALNEASSTKLSEEEKSASNLEDPSSKVHYISRMEKRCTLARKVVYLFSRFRKTLESHQHSVEYHVFLTVVNELASEVHFEIAQHYPLLFQQERIACLDQIKTGATLAANYNEKGFTTLPSQAVMKWFEDSENEAFFILFPYTRPITYI